MAVERLHGEAIGIVFLIDTIAGKHFLERDEHYLHVDEKRQMVDIPDIVLKLLCPGEGVASVALRPSGNAWLHLMPPALRDAGLFVIAHCGIDLGFVDTPMSCGPKQIAALLRAVPGLTFVAAHLGGCGGNPPHATDELLEFPNCHFDTAVVCCCDDDPESQRVMAEWPADRLLFATDYFWRDETFIAGWVRRCRPDPADLEKIFSGNARRLLGC